MAKAPSRSGLVIISLNLATTCHAISDDNQSVHSLINSDAKRVGLGERATDDGEAEAVGGGDGAGEVSDGGGAGEGSDLRRRRRTQRKGEAFVRTGRWEWQ